ncbi:338_t:CDS:1, partial [Racocetra fulgida]
KSDTSTAYKDIQETQKKGQSDHKNKAVINLDEEDRQSKRRKS